MRRIHRASGHRGTRKIMSTIRFQVTDDCGNLIGGQCATVREAVFQAVSHDGWGATYQRDAEGVMRLYSSHNHIGNNPYFPSDIDAFYEGSALPDDDAAIAELADAVRARGILHNRYSFTIVELTYNDSDVLVEVDGQTVEELAEQSGCDVADIHRQHEGELA